MPLPLSEISILTRDSTGAAVIVSAPPAGIASRLLLTRFRIESSSSSLFASIDGSDGETSTVSAIRDMSSFGRATSATRDSSDVILTSQRVSGRLALSSIVRTTEATLPICS